MIWPLGLITQALTSTDDNEILNILQILKSTTGGTGLMHESFNKDDPSCFTRPWFAWANSLFGELILNLAEGRPHLIFSNSSVPVGASAGGMRGTAVTRP